MTDVPAHVVGFRATGHVTKEDYDSTFVPAVEKAAKETGHINLLMVFETSPANFSYGAWMQDAKMSLKHFGHWHKIAVVTDQKFLQNLSYIFNFLSPAEAKGFPVSDIEIAKNWVAAPKASETKH